MLLDSGCSKYFLILANITFFHLSIFTPEAFCFFPTREQDQQKNKLTLLEPFCTYVFFVLLPESEFRGCCAWGGFTFSSNALA